MRHAAVPTLCALAASLFLGGAVRAESIQFDADIAGLGNLLGSLTLIGSHDGIPAGALISDVSSPDDVFLLFEITLDETSLPWGGRIDPPVNGLTGGLWILSSDVSVVGGGGFSTGAPFLSVIGTTDGSGLISNNYLQITGAAVPAGTTSEHFYASYTEMPTEFTLSAWFVEPDSPLGVATQIVLGSVSVPEPAPGLMLGLGLASGLTHARRLRGAKRR